MVNSNDKENTKHQTNQLYTSSIRASSVQSVEECTRSVPFRRYNINDNLKWASCNRLLDSNCNVCMILNDEENGGTRNESNDI